MYVAGCRDVTKRMNAQLYILALFLYIVFDLDRRFMLPPY
jgi:hypothetical protein